MYPVKYFHSDMQGAPSLNSTAGSVVALLDACLINGFNLVTLDSLTYDSVAGVVTGTVGAGHGFEVDQVILIAGADQAEYNGEQRVTFIDSTTFQYKPSAAPSATPATGASITAKAAPIGTWEKAFDDGLGTKAAYRSTDPTATGLLLRVDDINTKSGWNTGAGSPARTWVEGAESMTDIDTVNGSFGGGWWGKNRTDANNCKWLLVGDGLAFYFIPWIAAGPNPAGFFFGDINTVRAGDAFHGLLVTGSQSGESWTSTGGQNWSALATLASNWNKTLARQWHQLPGVAAANMAGSGLSGTLGATAGLPYPNPDDNSLYMVGALNVLDQGLRGSMPGLYQLVQQTTLPDRAHIANVTGFDGLIFVAAQVTVDKNSTTVALAAFDVAGPWR